MSKDKTKDEETKVETYVVAIGRSISTPMKAIIDQGEPINMDCMCDRDAPEDIRSKMQQAFQRNIEIGLIVTEAEYDKTMAMLKRAQEAK